METLEMQEQQSPVALDELTVEEFKEMIENGIYEAQNKMAMPLNKVMNRIRNEFGL